MLFARHDCLYCIQDKWILQQPFSSSFITFICILHYIRIISLSLVKIRSSQSPVHGSKIFMISPLFAILDTQGKNPDHSTWRGRNKPCWRLDRAPDWSTLQRQFPSLPMLFHLQSSFRFQSFEQPLQIVILQGKCPMWGFWRRQKVNQIYRINKLSAEPHLRRWKRKRKSCRAVFPTVWRQGAWMFDSAQSGSNLWLFASLAASGFLLLCAIFRWNPGQFSMQVPDTRELGQFEILSTKFRFGSEAMLRGGIIGYPPRKFTKCILLFHRRCAAGAMCIMDRKRNANRLIDKWTAERLRLLQHIQPCVVFRKGLTGSNFHP